MHASIFSFVGLWSQSGTTTYEQNSTALTRNSQTVALLEPAVHVDPNPAKGGGDITIVEGAALLPDAGPAGTQADLGEGITSDRISLYVVREGDSLSQIAKMFNVTTNTIIWANDIKRGDLIQQGQTLVILPISGIRHTVEKGDTIKSIAKDYKGDIDEILVYNDLTLDSTLAVGDVVVIPDGEMSVPTYSSSGSTQVVRGSGGPTYKGYYMRPLQGGTKTQGIHGYNAVDIGASAGTPILASADGQVLIVRNSGWNGGYGNYIVIKHNNGTQTLYAHNSSNIVRQGEYVVQGQVIGYVGSTGRSTGNHLHFEIRGATNPF